MRLNFYLHHYACIIVELQDYLELRVFTSLKSNHKDVRLTWATDFPDKDLFRGIMGIINEYFYDDTAREDYIS